MSAKRGKQPLIPSASTQENINLSGFINPETGKSLLYECATFNYYETTLPCLEAFAATQPKGKRVLIVLDNASWHKKAVRIASEENRFEERKFLFLSPYSPDYNPIERS